MLEIRAPKYFHVPGHLAWRLDKGYQDPRENDFAPEQVVLDLRDCVVVNHPAALWCVIYTLLVRQKGIPCQVRIPNDSGLCAALAAQRFFSTLTGNGVELLGSFQPAGTTADDIIFPISSLASAHESEMTAYEIQSRLQQRRGVSANIPSLVAEIFLELVNNAFEHAESPVGRFATVQMRDQSRVLCAVADGGIGITASLGHNPAVPPFQEDRDAILLALEEGITGTDSPTRGIGLNWVSNASGLIIYSGDGLVENGSDVARRGVAFPGTLALSTCGGR